MGMRLTQLGVFFLAGMAIPAPAFAGAIDELNPDQQRQLEQGHPVFFTQDVDSSDWPRMFVYQVIHCTPEQAEAVTMDYELRPTYTSELVSAKNEAPITSPTATTDYVASIPVLGKQAFTLQQTVSSYAAGTSYRLDFHMLHGDNTKSSEGYTRFEPYGNGETLMAVVQLTVPDVFGAGLVVGEAESRVRDAATGFGTEVEKEIAKDPERLQAQISALKNVLAPDEQPADWALSIGGMVVPSATLGCRSISDPTDRFLPPTEAPIWATTSRGEPVDLVQMYLHGSLTLIEGIFQDKGWVQALPQDVPDDVAYGVAVLGGVSWITNRMPVSDELVCGQHFVVAMEKNNHPLGGRDHFRVFAAGKDAQGRSVWAISASRDTGLRIDPNRPNQGFINHSSEPNEDLERDRVLADLQADSAVASMQVLQLKRTGYAIDNDAYSADGRVYDIVIK